MEVHCQLSTLDSLDALHYGSRRFCRATDQRWDLGDYALAQHQGHVAKITTQKIRQNFESTCLTSFSLSWRAEAGWKVYECGRNRAGMSGQVYWSSLWLVFLRVIDASVGNPRHVLRTLDEDYKISQASTARNACCICMLLFCGVSCWVSLATSFWSFSISW